MLCIPLWPHDTHTYLYYNIYLLLSSPYGLYVVRRPPVYLPSLEWHCLRFLSWYVYFSVECLEHIWFRVKVPRCSACYSYREISVNATQSTWFKWSFSWHIIVIRSKFFSKIGTHLTLYNRLGEKMFTYSYMDAFNVGSIGLCINMLRCPPLSIEI